MINIDKYRERLRTQGQIYARYVKLTAIIESTL